MKTKSVRAIISDAKILEQTARELAAELQMQVPVSSIIHGLMECLENAKEKIKRDAEQIGEKRED